MEPRGSMLHSQGLSNNPYPEPNLIGDDIRTIERNADVLLNACKDIG